jgi:2-polyprenyl-3-methyl-5-hydroxy-6-metoxy-1,4-benzoquinol methylase
VQQRQIAERSCPLCGGRERRPVLSRDGWDVARCAACGMVYLAQEISYAQQRAEHDFELNFERERRRRRQRHPLLTAISGWTRKLKPEIGERLLAQTLRWAQSGRLADFGCSDGQFLEQAARHFQVTGIEISPRMAAVAQQRVPAATIHCCPLVEAPLAEGAFDVVTAFSVLEHEWRPLEALRLAHRALRPGGTLILKTPNHASWNRALMRGDWCGYRLPDHCNYFTPATLVAMLHKAQFEPLPSRFLDRLPTSDSLWMAARRF